MSGGGGTGFSGFLTRAARSVLENALNATLNANNGASGSGVQETFFDLGGSDMFESDDGIETVIEYAGREASTEIAEIYPISLRAGDLILHGPRKEMPDTFYGTYSVYNIILHATNSNSSSERMYSLFRTDSEPEASRVFVIYKQIFPDLVKASTSSLDTKALERIIKMSRKHESYAATHIAAALGMVDQLKHPALRDKLIEQEGKELLTALHVACIHAQLDAFKAIAEDERTFNRVYDYEDNKGNNICHMAAACEDKTIGAAIIKILKEKLIVNQTGSKRASCTGSLLQLFMKLNNEGNAPIHLACLASNKKVVEELTTIEGATLPASDRLNLQDIKAAATGSTPLHLVTSDSELLSHLLSSGSDPNITDNDGLTPLHKAVLQSNLKSTLQLLANGAFPDFTATYENFCEATALHLAASFCSVDCIKALIVFGADLEARDGNGHTARHIVASISSAIDDMKQEALFVLAAAGAKRCTLSLVRGNGCSEGCKPGGRNNGKKPETWLVERDGTTPSSEDAPVLLVHEAMRGLGTCTVRESYDSNVKSSGDNQLGPVVGGRLLTIDGGGMRGLVLTQMLFFMEKEFGNISGGGSPIISYFDWVAGTSTGGIMALALASGMSVLETQSLYMKLKDEIFTGNSATRMEEFLKRVFGADRKMSSIQKPKVMIMAALATRMAPDLYIFRNYISPSSLLGDPGSVNVQFPDDVYIWEAAMATSAAHSAFKLNHELFLNGCLISNNPTLDALSELVQFSAVMMESQHKVDGQDNTCNLPSMVVSLGSGIPKKEKSSTSNLDIRWPTGVFDAISNTARAFHLVNLLVDQATQSEGQVVERARAWCTAIGVPFYRFSPQVSAGIGLDEMQDNKVFINLMWETWCYMVGRRGEIKEIFERLQDLDVGRMTSPGRSDFMDVP